MQAPWISTEEWNMTLKTGVERLLKVSTSQHVRFRFLSCKWYNIKEKESGHCAQAKMNQTFYPSSKNI